MKDYNINLPIFSVILGIFTWFLNIISFIAFNYSDRLMFTFLFSFVDQLSFVSTFFTWTFAGVGLLTGVKGLKDKKRKAAKWGIGLNVFGFVIYVLLIVSLYLRFGMIG